MPRLVTYTVTRTQRPDLQQDEPKMNDFSNGVVRVAMFRCYSLCRSEKMPFLQETYACVVGCGNERKLKPCRSLRYKKDGGKRFDRNAFDLLQLLQTTINVRLYNKTFYARYFFSLVNQTLRVSLRTAGAGKFRQLGKAASICEKAEGMIERAGVSRYPLSGSGVFWIIVVFRK